MSYFCRLMNLVFAAFITFSFSSCSVTEVASESSAALSDVQDGAFKRVKVALCDKQIALLGEGPNHGEGTTVAFKAKLAQALIEDCGFSLLLFESSLYEAVKVNRDISEGRMVDRQDVEAVISFLWRDEVEMGPLINFLHKAVNSGSLTIGGIDDQIGSRGQDYANFVMPIDITKGMVETKGMVKVRKDECRAALSQRIFYSFAEDDPYNVSKKQFILSCLKNIVEGKSDAEPYDPHAAMTESLYRMVHRDLINNRSRIIGRERSMYKNFEYWFNRRGDTPKTIIWGATVHTAKSGSVLDLSNNDPHFGALINSQFEEDAYVVGFSSLTGSHSLMGRGISDLPAAPESSIEAVTFEITHGDVAFLSAAELMRFGEAPAAAMTNSYQVRDWSSLLDGMVIFREQKPPIKSNEELQ
ncbi:erythromycin esterase family protein [Hellea balneolensis]|uniref:erythromycin esterase family protein n=1 Tax=Hellea balneolensis TaxID=287478 RepID=UPI00041FFA4B|nr:erythromycin esterase family protein [Hellea balneolensis]